MSLETKVMEQLKDAMKAKDEVALRTLRAIKAAILLEKTSGGDSEEITETDEIRLITKLAKQRKDSLEIYIAQNREDLAQKEREEIGVLERFLPQQLSENELIDELKKIIAQSGASSVADLGKVMGIASKVLSGKADGKMISEKAKLILAGSL